MKHIKDYINEQAINTLLWIDDLRDPMSGDWIKKYSPIGNNVNVIWIKTYKDFCKWIDKYGLPAAVCFDHDLGDTSNDEKTGYDCAKYLVDYCIDNNCDIPKFAIQSDNGPGRKNIQTYLDNYHKHFTKS